ncbi:MAG: hypothetical protein JST42_00010 [Bacteroidetes bacterium]|nr:hypothetical protein [Bacteroidota bacterium]
MSIHILVLGRDRAILGVVERLINSHEGWKATVVGTGEEAFAALGEQEYRILFVSAGITAEEEAGLREKTREQYPHIVVTRHFGGGSGLLENEILSILNHNNYGK